jgi:hypothetical protein
MATNGRQCEIWLILDDKYIEKSQKIMCFADFYDIIQ